MKTSHLLYLSIVLTIISSCTKLERKDFQNIPVDQFFKTEADARAAVTDYYATAIMDLNVTAYSSNGTMGESQTDLMEYAWDGGPGYLTNHFFMDATNYGSTIDSYSIIVKHISRGTNLIPKLESIPMEEALRKRYIAEVRALRTHVALWGYYMYGGVELFLNADTLADVSATHYKNRATKKEMADFIISEINAVKNDLAPKYSYSDPNYGRMTQGAALTIKLKVLMQEKRFAEAALTAREIITIGYGLVPVYKDIFTIANEGNIETIWSIPCKTNVWPALYYTGDMLPYDFPTAKPISKWGVWKIRWGFYDSFDPLDERRKLLIAEYTNTSGQLVKRGTDELANGCINTKYEVDPDMTGNWSGTDFIIFRYADVLLLLVEAINENNNGPTPEAIDLVNQIRARAFPGMPDKLLNLSDYAGDKAKFNDVILKERGWELYMEWHRRQDLVRHGKFMENALSVSPRGSVDDHIILWPIPTDIVNQSKGIVKQNPGY